LGHRGLLCGWRMGWGLFWELVRGIRILRRGRGGGRGLGRGMEMARGLVVLGGLVPVPVPVSVSLSGSDLLRMGKRFSICRRKIELVVGVVLLRVLRRDLCRWGGKM